jgi:hypothetical protein
VTSTTIKVFNNSGLLQLRIYDVLGKEVKNLSTDTNEFKIYKDNLEVGVYLLKVFSEDGSLKSSKKLIVR